MQSGKEKLENLSASAKAGMEKTKATLQEKAEKLTTRDPLEKRVAEQKKEGRIAEAELRKQEAREKNYAEKEAARSGGHTTGVTTGHPTGVTTGHATGVTTGHSVGPLPSEYVESGTVGTRPVVTGTGTGTGRTTIAHNP